MTDRNLRILAHRGPARGAGGVSTELRAGGWSTMQLESARLFVIYRPIVHSLDRNGMAENLRVCVALDGIR
jgi:hypothetical protein